MALTLDEIGLGAEKLYENLCTFETDPDISFNYAQTEELKEWGYLEGCFSCTLLDKKDIIIQTVSIYDKSDGANKAYFANVKYYKQHSYGRPIEAPGVGEQSILFRKAQEDGTTYSLIFIKKNVLVGISVKYKTDEAKNTGRVADLGKKIEAKIN